jgi:ABC-type multidrug transport system ATPase subunit
VSNLSGGERQLVSISRTMLSDPKIVIMDEPTSALSVEGADRVLNLIERMQSQGISIILISLDILLRVNAEESRAVGVSGLQSNHRTTSPSGHG